MPTAAAEPARALPPAPFEPQLSHGSLRSAGKRGQRAQLRWRAMRRGGGGPAQRRRLSHCAQKRALVSPRPHITTTLRRYKLASAQGRNARGQDIGMGEHKDGIQRGRDRRREGPWPQRGPARDQRENVWCPCRRLSHAWQQKGGSVNVHRNGRGEQKGACGWCRCHRQVARGGRVSQDAGRAGRQERRASHGDVQSVGRGDSARHSMKPGNWW